MYVPPAAVQNSESEEIKEHVQRQPVVHKNKSITHRKFYNQVLVYNALVVHLTVEQATAEPPCGA